MRIRSGASRCFGVCDAALAVDGEKEVLFCGWGRARDSHPVGEEHLQGEASTTAKTLRAHLRKHLRIARSHPAHIAPAPQTTQPPGESCSQSCKTRLTTYITFQGDAAVSGAETADTTTDVGLKFLETLKKAKDKTYAPPSNSPIFSDDHTLLPRLPH